MAKGMPSGCINHPGIEAAFRCKQCGKPVCDTCVVQGPTGNFCSEPCKEKHETFVQRAADIEAATKYPRVKWTRRVWRFVTKSIIILVLVLFIGFVLSYFEIRIPYLSDVIAWGREKLNL